MLTSKFSFQLFCQLYNVIRNVGDFSNCVESLGIESWFSAEGSDIQVCAFGAWVHIHGVGEINKKPHAIGAAVDRHDLWFSVPGWVCNQVLRSVVFVY